MIESLKIADFKCLHSAEFCFKKLNIITGINSSGKSSVVQAMLLFSDAMNESSNFFEKWPFEVIRNRYYNAKKVEISLDRVSIEIEENVTPKFEQKRLFEKNKDFFYLSENRTGPETFEKINISAEIGDRAEYVGSVKGLSQK